MITVSYPDEPDWDDHGCGGDPPPREEPDCYRCGDSGRVGRRRCWDCNPGPVRRAVRRLLGPVAEWWAWRAWQRRERRRPGGHDEEAPF